MFESVKSCVRTYAYVWRPHTHPHSPCSAYVNRGGMDACGPCGVRVRLCDVSLMACDDNMKEVCVV